LDEKQTTTSKRLNIDLLRDILSTHLFGIGNRLVFVPTIDSTNTRAMHMAQNGSEEGVVVLTDSQQAGRGRLGRRWLDQAGLNAITSTILYPAFPLYLLVMLASLAVVDAIADVCDVQAAIKWPNDVLIEDKKVCGILIETCRTQQGRTAAIVGIGINVNGDVVQMITPETAVLQTTATTLESECGHVVSREQLIARLLYYLEEAYISLQQEDARLRAQAERLVLDRWRDRLYTLGRTITVRQGDNVLSGIAEDVSNHGELILRSHTGEQISIAWGDVGYPTE
jgi:BirA family biotin operon repressor/biotin-[acetyl-CoA-carboxylase] ligase